MISSGTHFPRHEGELVVVPKPNQMVVRPAVGESGSGRWVPEVRGETREFLGNVVPTRSRRSVCEAAVSILAKGIPPSSPSGGEETGLVVGYVQSGKTMSFETVAALARDNEFHVVIVVAGRSIPLLEQSTGRLRRDLGLDDEGRKRRWTPFKNPVAGESTVQAIRDALEDWRDAETPQEYKKTILITVLKDHRHLRNLTTVVRAVELTRVPVLVIDDEADQASLNVEVAQGQESTIYRCLMALRQALPCHTYLQYTATPQAPLLVSIIDSLSPNFVQVLDPGEEYVGGREFFAGDRRHIRVIPSHEVPTRDNPLTEPPETLLEALRVFMVGVAARLLVEGTAGNRSMLVHPSHRTVQHQEFHSWIRDVVEEWKRILRLAQDDPDRRELIEEFREAYGDLVKTASASLPPFDELIGGLFLAFRNTRVLEVNARGGSTPRVDWRDAYGWILVGGQAMDRGFTVEGLTVTYMPRGIGVGNADTVQQRGRFFGYKKSYLDYCRIYLEPGTVDAFCAYVEHEEDIRRQLKRAQEENQPLNQWKRAFFLDTALRPCRNQVIEFDYMRGRIADDWVVPRMVLASEAVVEENRQVVGGFVDEMVFTNNVGHADRTATERHVVCGEVPLRRVVEELLVRIRITGTVDSQRNMGLLLLLTRGLEQSPEEVCTVYRMSPGARRTRTVDENGEIGRLFQGAAPVFPVERRGKVYPGDSAICERNAVTIQIHTLDLKGNKDTVMETVPVIAVWVPKRLGKAWVTQEQPGQ